MPPEKGIARWGLFLLLLLTALALVLGALVGLRSARQASLAVARASGFGMVRELRRELHHSAGDFKAALDNVMQGMADEGLRYAAVLDADHHVLAEVGQAPSAHPQTWRQRTPEKVLSEPSDDGTFSVLVSLMPRPSGRSARDGRVRRGRRRGLPAGFMKSRWEGAGGRQGLGFLALEFDPVDARGILRRAFLTLIVSVIAASLLLLAGLFFWRMQGQADRLRSQLAADSELKSLGQMSAVLGHELRNPLTSLKGHAQLLVEFIEKDKPGRSSAERVVVEAERLEQLTSEVLDFAKSGQIQVRDVELDNFFQQCVERANSGHVRIDLDPKLSAWRFDPGRLERVLANLLRNARQAAGAQGVIQLTARRQGAYLHLEVRDDGPGLPEADLERIFEPFMTTHLQGTGLGLALAKRIVEAHAGEIYAGPAPGGGALFVIRLPE